MIGYVRASAGDFLLLRTALELLLIPKSDLGKSLHREQLSALDLRKEEVQRTSTFYSLITALLF